MVLFSASYLYLLKGSTRMFWLFFLHLCSRKCFNSILKLCVTSKILTEEVRRRQRMIFLSKLMIIIKAHDKESLDIPHP